MLSIYSAASETTGETYHVTIDQSRDSLLSEASHVLLKEGKYMLPEETSPQEAFARASIAFGSNQDHAQRLYDAVSQLWFMYASPVLSNAGNPRGLPASCALTYMGDSREEIADTWKEMLFLSTLGAGVGLSMSALRSVGTGNSRGTSTPGLIPFMKVIDSITMASKQGEVRRGATAVYLDISHPEFQEFLVAREASDGGDINRKCQNIHTAVNISDEFMEAVIEGKDWQFVDPHTKQIKGSASARTIWMDILKMRMKTGEPYLHFIDASNRAMPQVMKDKGLRIHQSNLCSEITLPTAPNRTAMCFLSSLNLERFDDWKDSSIVEDMVEMLDNVIDVYIRKAPPELWKSVASAKAERSVGLGMMGFHSYLQAQNVAFEGPIAAAINRRIFKHIDERARAHSKLLAKERGEAPDMEGTGERFSFISAIAPNASSSVLCNFTSPSVEPFNANIYVQKTRRGAFILKNKHLDLVLTHKYGLVGEALERAWDKIQEDGGSVQDLPFMDEQDKSVFKTAFELDQRWIVEHASQRQPYVSQAQSINLFFPLDIPFQVLHTVHKEAWEKGLKTLYYVRSKSASQIKRTTISTSDCVACEG